MFYKRNFCSLEFFNWCQVSMRKKTKHLSRDSCVASTISTHCAAQCLVNEIMRVKPAGTPQISLLAIDLVQYLEWSGTPYGTQESFLPSDVWVKFNNNADLVMRKDGFNHDLIQAFSHWTHHRSGEEIMVVDCQGIFYVPSNTFMLTDPAIHCQDILRFGATNLGKDGFK